VLRHRVSTDDAWVPSRLADRAPHRLRRRPADGRGARQNLALLRPEGLDDRAHALRRLHEQFGKESHAFALESVRRLATLSTGVIATDAFQADAGDASAVRSGLGDGPPDVVVSDVPYGRLKHWSAPDAAAQILPTLHRVLADDAVVALSFPRREPLDHPGFARLQRLKIGKREAYVLRRE
jgi:hypothetical protein